MAENRSKLWHQCGEYFLGVLSSKSENKKRKWILTKYGFNLAFLVIDSYETSLLWEFGEVKNGTTTLMLIRSGLRKGQSSLTAFQGRETIDVSSEYVREHISMDPLEISAKQTLIMNKEHNEHLKRLRSESIFLGITIVGTASICLAIDVAKERIFAGIALALVTIPTAVFLARKFPWVIWFRQLSSIKLDQWWATFSGSLMDQIANRRGHVQKRQPP